METTENKLVLPDDLVRLWESAHQAPGSGGREPELSLIWEKLYKSLAGSLNRENTPGITNNDDGIDAAMDYIIFLLKGSCPQHLKSFNLLHKNFRKYLAKNRNPVQYELNQILHTALLFLEKEGAICRGEAYLKKNIMQDTLFALAGTPGECMGSIMKYEQNKSSVPHYTTKIRNNNPEETRIITPENANDLVLKLLAAFGGWISKQELLSAMMKHIPEQFIIQLKFGKDEEDQDDQAANIASECDSYIYEHEREQSYAFGFEMTEKIWERITQVSSKVFCLFFLPKNLYGQKVKLADIGPKSTVDDQNRKIVRILEEELVNFKDYFAQTYKERDVQNLVVRKIFDFLQNRCTEIGYSPDLYMANGERNTYENI